MTEIRSFFLNVVADISRSLCFMRQMQRERKILHAFLNPSMQKDAFAPLIRKSELKFLGKSKKVDDEYTKCGILENRKGYICP